MRTAAIILILMSASAGAEKVITPMRNTTIEITGNGYESCGDLIKAQNLEERGLQSTVVVIKSWIYGYLSGIASDLSHYSSMNILKDITPNGIDVWMHNYCKDHPLERIKKATDALSDQLIINAYEDKTKPKEK